MTQSTRGPWLEPFDGEVGGRCPKCLTQPVMTQHHETVVVGMCKERRDMIVTLSDHPDQVPDEMTEHLCRGCPVCGYVWSEHVASPEDMARVKASAACAD